MDTHEKPLRFRASADERAIPNRGVDGSIPPLATFESTSCDRGCNAVAAIVRVFVRVVLALGVQRNDVRRLGALLGDVA